jgi:uncharacterized membrane protein YeaQ/YmgE (transglycosylase-associated protein family)
MCFDLLIWGVVGLAAGGVARLIVPGEDPMGCLATMLLGVAGSVVGGLLGFLLSGNPYHPSGFVGSVIGAVIVLLAWRRTRGPTRPLT